MTRQVKYSLQCRDCKESLVCPKCGKEIPHGTPFSNWLRKLKKSELTSTNFNNQNLDYIWYNWRKYWFITIEEKQECGKSSEAQYELHHLLKQILYEGTKSGKIFNVGRRGEHSVEYRGHYLIVFQNTTPENSKYIKINGIEIREKENIPMIIKSLLEHGELNGILSNKDGDYWTEFNTESREIIIKREALLRERQNE